MNISLEKAKELLSQEEVDIICINIPEDNYYLFVDMVKEYIKEKYSNSVSWEKIINKESRIDYKSISIRKNEKGIDMRASQYLVKDRTFGIDSALCFKADEFFIIEKKPKRKLEL